MTKVKGITIELPSEEEFDKMLEEDFEEHLSALDNVESVEELVKVLKDFGITVIDEDEADDELPGPNDTIH
jgi:DNA polymerase III alpha subunit (gram-positive type)